MEITNPEFIPFPLIMFTNTELRHKRLDGCRKKRSNTERFFLTTPIRPTFFPGFSKQIENVINQMDSRFIKIND